MSLVNTTTTIQQDIKNYVAIEDEYQSLQDKMKKLREQKRELQETLKKKLRERNLKNKIIKVGEYSLTLFDKKQYSPLSFVYLEKKLSDIIHDKEQLEYLIDYLKDNREVKTVEDIRSIKKS